MSDQSHSGDSDLKGRVIDAASRFGDPRALLKGGGGGGTSDEMEARVTRLEKNMDQVATDVGAVKVDVAILKENVRHLPTKPWMFTTLAALLVSLSIIVGLIVRFIPHAP